MGEVARVDSGMEAHLAPPTPPPLFLITNIYIYIYICMFLVKCVCIYIYILFLAILFLKLNFTPLNNTINFFKGNATTITNFSTTF